jgi:CubicO group peptidase (beta-lactamase class C family)
MKKEYELQTETPENLGIASEHIENLIEDFRKNGLFMHSFILLRHGKVAAEGYYKPISPDRLTRLYSSSKTFVSAAIGILCDEGKISLTDKVHTFFPDMCPSNLHPYIADTTIRDLLIMASPLSGGSNFGYGRDGKEWVKSFFNAKPDVPPNTIFYYNTCGTYVLCAIAERITGMPFLDYMYDKLFKHIGFSNKPWCIKGPDGYSWGGSGVMCTPRDFAKFALVFMNKGNINGKQLISEDYIKAATSKQIDNNLIGHESRLYYGYGYQIWITRDNSFSIRGMGNQDAICVPEKDLVFVCTADNQGTSSSSYMISSALWNHIIDKISDSPLQENKLAYQSLLNKTSNLELLLPSGEKHSELERQISGTTFEMNENPMEISKVRLEFLEDYGKFCYSTLRGDKEILFGYGEYKEGTFPETHYFGDTIGTPCGRPYNCLAAGVWVGIDQSTLLIKVHVIDDSLGNLIIKLAFKGDELGMAMRKTAEWFLDEYDGHAGGTKYVANE